jgi:hypothetical protein
MYAIAKLPDEERRTIFRNTATKMLLNEAMVEKDFWLCVILDYPRKWARYDLAKLGTLKLYPPVHSLEILKADYQRMEDMFYGTYPKFAVMMDGIKELEIEINNLITNDMTF